MRKQIQVLLIGLFISFMSCEDNRISEINSANNSALHYYELSRNGEFPLENRLEAINKALFLQKRNEDTLFGHVLYEKNFLHLYMKQYDSLLFFNDATINSSILRKDNLILAKQHYLMGYYYAELAQISDSAFKNYNSSRNFYEKKGDSSWVGRNLLNMGTIQKDQNDFFGSKETLTEALKYLKPKKDIRNISSSYNILATNHRRLLNYLDAIKYYLKAIETTDSEEDRLIYQNNLAATYIHNQQFDKALMLLKEIAERPLLTNNKKEYARVLDNLAYVNWLDQKKENEKEFLEPLRIRKENNDKRGQIASYTHLGEFHGKTNPRKAKLYFDSVIQLSRILKIPRAEKDALKFLIELEPRNVNLHKRYVFLQDSLYEQELKVKTQFAKYKYDDKLKQESILRLEKTNAEKELEIARQENQKIISYSIGGILLLVFGFVIYFFIQRSKRLKQLSETAKLEATFETEAELSRRLHDDFGGKLNHAMLLLQSETSKEEVLKIVDGLYNQSRDFSREINDVDTGSNFKDTLFAMMGNYSKNTKLIVTGSTDIDWFVLSPLSKKTLFKVLQELMINMKKYSKASLVSFVFLQTKKKLKITYTDDGAGASKEELNFKNGLLNTEKRIRAIGGTIIFDSDKGRGFEAQIEIPN